jgi:hypothetical protein
MKKYFILFVFIFIETNLIACDICGCGSGSYYIGLMPQFHKNFVGIRYRYSIFDSHLGHSHHGIFATQETFRTTEIWGRFYPHQVANTYVDNVEVRLRPIASISTGGDIILNQIGRGQVLQIEGKIEEDRALEYVRIAWGPTGQETQIVDLKGTDITLPFDFADARSINRFRVPDTRNVDTYTLIIRVKDLKNAEVVIRYVFRVI